jgi:hypothetical protein
MAKLRSIAMLMALGVAGAAFAAQTPAPPSPADAQATPPTGTESQSTQSPDPESASSPHQRQTTKQQTDESATTQSPDPQGASTPHQKGAVGKSSGAGMTGTHSKLVGLQVESPTGEALGSVVDVTMDSSRQPEYVVISMGNDTQTAVPYSAVSSMIKGNKVVMDRTRLQNSPQVAQSELKDKANTKWRSDADKYWSAGAIRSASPGGAGTGASDRPQPQER